MNAEKYTKYKTTQLHTIAHTYAHAYENVSVCVFQMRAKALRLPMKNLTWKLNNKHKAEEKGAFDRAKLVQSSCLNATINAKNYINIQFNTHTYKIKLNLHNFHAQWQQQLNTLFTIYSFLLCVCIFAAKFVVKVTIFFTQ